MYPKAVKEHKMLRNPQLQEWCRSQAKEHIWSGKINKEQANKQSSWVFPIMLKYIKHILSLLGITVF